MRQQFLIHLQFLGYLEKNLRREEGSCVKRRLKQVAEVGHKNIETAFAE